MDLRDFLAKSVAGGRRRGKEERKKEKRTETEKAERENLSPRYNSFPVSLKRRGLCRNESSGCLASRCWRADMGSWPVARLVLQIQAVWWNRSGTEGGSAG